MRRQSIGNEPTQVPLTDHLVYCNILWHHSLKMHIYSGHWERRSSGLLANELSVFFFFFWVRDSCPEMRAISHTCDLSTRELQPITDRSKILKKRPLVIAVFGSQDRRLRQYGAGEMGLSLVSWPYHFHQQHKGNHPQCADRSLIKVFNDDDDDDDDFFFCCRGIIIERIATRGLFPVFERRHPFDNICHASLIMSTPVSMTKLSPLHRLDEHGFYEPCGRLHFEEHRHI